MELPSIDLTALTDDVSLQRAADFATNLSRESGEKRFVFGHALTSLSTVFLTILKIPKTRLSQSHSGLTPFFCCLFPFFLSDTTDPFFLPVGSVHGKKVTSWRFRNTAQDDSSYGRKAKLEALEEILKTSVAALIGNLFTIRSRCQNHKINGAMKQDCGNEQAKILESSVISVQV